jgi:arabinosyltransferase C
MQDDQSRLYAILFAVGAAVACLLPAILGHWTDGYLGYQYNTDDHMVYSAWMRQAMDGRFFFDNRFTIDPQPGLTVHVFFLALGWIAKALGISATVTLVRAMLSGLFVWLAHCLIVKLTREPFAQKLALALTILGGGLGFLVWHNFGTEIVRPVFPPLRAMMDGRLPIDVWQPEAFVFPSMLTNCLFMAALCLMLVGLKTVLDARDSWKPVPLGFATFALLANIHSYDVALLGMVLVGFLAMELSKKRVSWIWGLRSVVIAAGAVGPALWIVHVLHADAVFRERAATPTYSPVFLPVFFGLLFLIVPALIGLWNREDTEPMSILKRRIGMSVAAAAMLLMCFLSKGYTGGYWMGQAAWLTLFAGVLAVLVLIASDDAVRNLLWAWALVGVVAIYFPALFQRKLAMGIEVPWAVLGAIGLAGLIGRVERGARNLATVLAILVLSGSSLLWLFRECALATSTDDVSNTTVHPVRLSVDERKIVDYLNAHRSDRTVVLAMPGIAVKGSQPDQFLTPLMPDLNPILSGLTGVYTFAGHWSETPDYVTRRNELTSFFLANGRNLDPSEFLKRTGADYIVAPVPEAFVTVPVPLRKMEKYGTVVVDGPQFRLIQVDRNRLHRS